MVPDDSVNGDEDLPGAGPVPVLAEPHPLPGAQRDAALTDGQRQVGAQQAGLVNTR